MSKVTVVDRIVELLAGAGISRIYGVTGESIQLLADAVRASSQMRWLPLRLEAAAVSAAAAEARQTRMLTVCAGNSGSGALRMLDRLHQAHSARIPVLAIAMHASTREIGRRDDEIHPEPLFRQCSGFCELVSHSHQMPRLLRRALETAVSRPGVAVLVLPSDVALRSALVTEPYDALRACMSMSTPERDAMRRSVGLSSSPNGLADALGVQLSCPNRLVFAVVDDAALSTLAGDLSALHEFDAPVKVIVIRHDRGPACSSEGVFAAVALATGVLGLVVRTATDAARTLECAIAHRGPAVVEVVGDFPLDSIFAVMVKPSTQTHIRWQAAALAAVGDNAGRLRV